METFDGVMKLQSASHCRCIVLSEIESFKEIRLTLTVLLLAGVNRILSGWGSCCNQALHMSNEHDFGRSMHIWSKSDGQSTLDFT